jgi:hypothetical protein
MLKCFSAYTMILASSMAVLTVFYAAYYGLAAT